MKVYSFKEITFLVNGRPITDSDEGDDAIIARRLEDSTSHKIDNRGKMIVNLTADRSGELVFRLDQTGKDNEFLSKIVQAAENGGFVPVFVQMTDGLGSDIVSGSAGYIPRPADMQRGNTSQGQEWRVVVENLFMGHGGSEELAVGG